MEPITHGLVTSPVTVLVTGGAGFVMSNFIKYLLRKNTFASVVLLDLSPLDALETDFFFPIADRLVSFQGDIRDRDLLNHIAAKFDITHLVHGAMLAHCPTWELENPSKYIDVNIQGTVNLLEWARGHQSFRRFLYISSGSVYGDPTPDHKTELQHETGPFNPNELYGITKLASERIVRRYGELYPFETFSLRFGPVFGPMEHPTVSRAAMSMPYHMMRSIIEDRPFRITQETLDGGRDHLSAEDIAAAGVQLLLKERLSYKVYNVAMGAYITGRQLVETLQFIDPAFHVEFVNRTEQADVVMDPADRYGRWNGYATERVCSEINWRPRWLYAQMKSYHKWIMGNQELRCPTFTNDRY